LIEPSDLMGLDIALTQTLASLWMAYQPIVRRDRSTFGYDALMRPAELAGLTSFSQLAPEIVKIDMSLVRGVDQNPRTEHILGRIAELCHNLGVQVVAEDFETIGERDALLRIECDLLQRFLLAKPGTSFPVARWPGSNR
jgi:EAL domain-containing protein (putative c-di-GMP-specific phosphodiesterase class I)